MIIVLVVVVVVFIAGADDDVMIVDLSIQSVGCKVGHSMELLVLDVTTLEYRFLLVVRLQSRRPRFVSAFSIRRHDSELSWAPMETCARVQWNRASDPLILGTRISALGDCTDAIPSRLNDLDEKGLLYAAVPLRYMLVYLVVKPEKVSLGLASSTELE